MGYITPNVYVEEVSKFPPSVSGVATAIPVFLGYTEKAEKNGKDLTCVPTRISGLLEFESIFGGPEKSQFAVNLTKHAATGEDLIKVTVPELKHLLHPSLRLFFNNGGGDCYIVSMGNYGTTAAKKDFISGLNALTKEDEPTLILLTDAINLEPADYYELQQQALAQCAKMKDRFAVIDVQQKVADQDVTTFRSAIGMKDLKYGAAYYPYLITTLNHDFDDTTVTVSAGAKGTGDGTERTWFWEGSGIKVTYTGPATKPSIVFAAKEGRTTAFDATEDEASGTLTIKYPTDKASQTAKNLLSKWDSKTSAVFSIELKDETAIIAEDKTVLLAVEGGAATQRTSYDNTELATIKSEDTELYNQIKGELGKIRIVLPPGPAVVGCYAIVDQERGVWKAPANVSLASVIGPTVKITNDDQDRLNVDPTTGISINAIRSFTGKGTLIWGARTLAGNDNEWRYVSVRRLFNYLEESIQKATSFAVFEPNNAMTWLKERTMIESFLDDLWRKGAMVGTTAEQAYFVQVGLGTTMTTQDILEGRMIIEVGIAAVRPAEFIILRFSHKVQEA